MTGGDTTGRLKAETCPASPIWDVRVLRMSRMQQVGSGVGGWKVTFEQRAFEVNWSFGRHNKFG